MRLVLTKIVIGVSLSLPYSTCRLEAKKVTITFTKHKMTLIKVVDYHRRYTVVTIPQAVMFDQ
jgi:hypothetical protein